MDHTYWDFQKENGEWVGFSEGDAFKVVEEDEMKNYIIKNFPDEEGVKLVNVWDTEGGIESFELVDINRDNLVKVEEHYESGDSAEAIYGKTDINEFVRQEYISRLDN